MNCSRISIDAYNPISNNVVACSTNGNIYVYCGILTHFTIDNKGVWLHDFVSYDKTIGKKDFHSKMKCYKHKDNGIYVKIGGKCYITCIAPTWMTRESIFC